MFHSISVSVLNFSRKGRLTIGTVCFSFRCSKMVIFPGVLFLWDIAGVCHWEQEKPVKPACSFRSFSCHRPQPSANVEITAYGLLANMRRGRDLGDSVCIAKWLAEQRNSYGGFRSTQVRCAA